MSKRNLTPDERDLWRRTVRDVAPMRDGGLDLGDRFDRSPAKGFPSSGAPFPSRQHPGKERPQIERTQDLFSAGDPRLDRHAARGRLPIDATFDLHGHNQTSARAALYAFIIEARRRGARCVLVITGKGARQVKGKRTGGVLRSRLGDWLNEEAFRQHINRVSAAHQRHGGSGAFYVFLKSVKPKRP